MYTFRRLAVVALLGLVALAACTAAPSIDGATPVPSTGDAEKVVASFLDAWGRNDYATMYSLLTPKSLLISPDDFATTYKQVESVLKPASDNGKTYQINSDKTVRQGNVVAVDYDMTFKSGTVGTFTDTDRIMRLEITPRGWRIAWSTMDIFEGMAGGATLSTDVTQASRGTIYDRNGKVIAADNTPNVSIKLVTTKFPTGKPADCFNKLADVLGIREKDLEQYAAFQGKEYGFWVGHLSKDDADADKAALDAVCLLEYHPQSTRFYYGGGMAPQVIGYVGRIPKEQLGNFPQYGPDALIGLDGIEKDYEPNLAGQPGSRLVITTPDGIEVRDIHEKDSSPAQDVTLTIDRELQLATQRAIVSAYNFANWAPYSTGAAIVVMDPHTGAILAIADYPTFDPDVFLPTTEYGSDMVTSILKERATFNRATQETYSLGSVFKIVSMAAAADTGAFKLDQIYDCTGTFADPEIAGGVRKDWIYLDQYVEQKFHGPITLIQALSSSCDDYFWQVGKTLNGIGNADQLSVYAHRFGLGVLTGIGDTIPEVAGYIPDPITESHKLGRPWGVGDNLNTVIGQGDVQVTTIQVARMMTAIASNGNLYTPYLTQQVGTKDQVNFVAAPQTPQKLQVDPAVLKGIQQGLCGATAPDKIPGTKDQVYGTANFVFYNWDFNKVQVCGKTGTAQNDSVAPNGWFAAYAGKPGQEPDLAIAAIVEHSREGSEVAGPIVRRIIESYYGLPQEPWPYYWTGPYDPMVDPGASDGGGPRPVSATTK